MPQQEKNTEIISTSIQQKPSDSMTQMADVIMASAPKPKIQKQIPKPQPEKKKPLTPIYTKEKVKLKKAKEDITKRVSALKPQRQITPKPEQKIQSKQQERQVYMPDLDKELAKKQMLESLKQEYLSKIQKTEKKKVQVSAPAPKPKITTEVKKIKPEIKNPPPKKKEPKPISHYTKNDEKELKQITGNIWGKLSDINKE